MRQSAIIEGHTYESKSGYLRRTVRSVSDLFVYYEDTGHPTDWPWSCRPETFANWAARDVTEEHTREGSHDPA